VSTVIRRPPGIEPRPSAPRGDTADSLINGILRRVMRWEVGLLLLIVIVAAGSSAASSNFLTPFNLETMALNATVLGFLALGVAPVIMTGDIDLSIASTLALCGVVMAVLWQHGMNIWLAAGLAIILGGVLGLVNGLVVVMFELPSLAVTLGSMSTYTGIAFLILQGNAIINFPPSLVQLGSGGLFDSGFPIASATLLLCAAVLAFIIHWTGFGKAVFAIGGNRQAARFSGVPVARTRILVFVIAGIFAALAAIFYLGNFDTAQANMASDQLLPAITAVILGGVSAYGGTGTIPGVVLALLLLQVLETGLGVAGLSGQEQTISVGVLLIIAISGGAAIGAVRNRFRRREQRSSTALPETEEVSQTPLISVDDQPTHKQGQ
jgi:ribose/xylose/arabinose/galactoside ABC-type transport system permease subunit